MASRPANHGKPWKDDEVAIMLKGVQDGKSHFEIARIHQRSYGGIRSKLRDIAADYYFNNNMQLKDIQKYTGLEAEVIADAISRREFLREKKQKGSPTTPSPFTPAPVTQIQDPPALVATIPECPAFEKPSELQELLEVMKDIRSMMKEFIAGNYVKVKRPPPAV